MFAEQIMAVARIRREMIQVPNIIGPAYGAPYCDKAMTVENALFRLELTMADADDIGISEPLREVVGKGLYQLRAALRQSAHENPLDKQIWPKGRRENMPPLSSAEHFTLGRVLKRADAELASLLHARQSQRPSSIRPGHCGETRKSGPRQTPHLALSPR